MTIFIRPKKADNPDHHHHNHHNHSHSHSHNNHHNHRPLKEKRLKRLPSCAKLRNNSFVEVEPKETSRIEKKNEENESKSSILLSWCDDDLKTQQLIDIPHEDIVSCKSYGQEVVDDATDEQATEENDECESDEKESEEEAQTENEYYENAENGDVTLEDDAEFNEIVSGALNLMSKTSQTIYKKKIRVINYFIFLSSNI